MDRFTEGMFELRLGLPGRDMEPMKSGGKRCFSETIDFQLKHVASPEDGWKMQDERAEIVEANKWVSLFLGFL